MRGILLTGILAQFVIAAQAQVAAPAPETQPPSQEETVHLSPFQVNGSNDLGYGAENTVGGTRVNSAIRDTPLSVVVATQQFLQDLDATQSYEALRFAAGVSGAGAPYSGQMTLRGQNLSGTTFRDGLPDVSTTGGAEMIDLALMDRVEAIEGPAGTLYGISSSGGIINAVTKAPLDTPYDSIKVTIGSYNVHRVDYDSTGPMDDSKRWSYRFIFADQSGTISMGGPDDALVAGLMTRYNFTEGKGFVLVRLTYEDIERGTNEYPWFDDNTGHISTFLSRNNPIPEKDAYREHKTTRFDAELDRNFKTGPIDWSARAAVRAENLSNIVSRLYEQADSFYQFFNSQGLYIGNMDNTSFRDPRVADIQVVQRTRSPASSKVQYGLTDIDALGKSQFGVVDNTLLVYAFEQSAYELDLTNSGPYPGIDLFHPFYYADPDTVASPEVQSNNSLSFNVTQAAAFQDNASLFQNKLILVVGARYDRKTQTSLNRITNVKVYNDVRAGTSHKLGIVVRPIDPLSVYYDYSETFNPSTFNQFTGAKYPNLLSENREAGFKFDAFRNQLVINTAVFNTTTSNVIIAEGNILGPGGLLEGISGPGGTLRTDGWESDGTWSIGRNFALLAGMGALNSKTATGAYARAVPLGFNYKGFAKYTFTIAPLNGLFVGYGYEHDSTRNGDGTLGGFIMPAYSTQNALIGWSDAHWRFQVNIENLADATYATIAVAGSIIYAGAPRNYQFEAAYTW